MDPTSGDKPGEGEASAVTSQTVTRRIKWPEPGPAPKEQPPPPEAPSRRSNMLWYAAAGVIVIICAVAIVAMRRHPPESVSAAVSAPKPPPLPAVVIQKPAPEVEPLPKPAVLAAVQAPKPPAEPAPRPTTPPASPAPVKPPSPYEAAVAEGEQAFGKRQLDRARAAFERAARARPGAAAPEYGLGRCLVQEGDPASAADHFRAAARAGMVESWFDLAEAQRVLSQNDDALESYRKYLASGGGKHAARARKLVAELGTP